MKNSLRIFLALAIMVLISCASTSISRENLEKEKDYKKSFFNSNEFTSSSINGFKLKAFEDKIVLNWDKLDSSLTYSIEKSVFNPKLINNKYVVDDYTYHWDIVTVVKSDKLTYEDKDVSPNKLYSYRVKGINSEKGIFSKESKTLSCSLNSKVSDIKVSKGKYLKYIETKWEPSFNAKEYEIEFTCNDKKVVFKTTTNSYNYYTDNPLKHLVRVRAIYKDGKSSYSQGFEGYILDLKAPLAPFNFTASKTKSSIFLKWDHKDLNVFYRLTRTNLSTNKTIVLSTDIKEKYYEDKTNLEQGVKYEYNLSCHLHSKYSQETSTIGSILSSPSDLKLIKFKDSTILKGSGTFGLDCDENCYYKIDDIIKLEPIDVELVAFDYENKTSKIDPITIKASDKINYIFADKTIISLSICLVTPNFTTKKVNVSIENKNDNRIGIDYGNFLVSNNNREEKDICNSKGFYPIKISWSKVSDAKRYIIYKAKVHTVDFKPIASTTNNYYLDTTCSTLGEKFDYLIRVVDQVGLIGKTSIIETGYAAISDKLFLETCDKYALNYFRNFSSSTIYQKVKEANFNSLGKASLKGSVNGIVDYYARVSGLGGLISFTYKNYQNNSYLIANGNFDIYSNIRQNGYFSGVLLVSGMYPGSINFTKGYLEDSLAKGTYLVSQNNGVTISSKQKPINNPPL